MEYCTIQVEWYSTYIPYEQCTYTRIFSSMYSYITTDNIENQIKLLVASCQPEKRALLGSKFEARELRELRGPEDPEDPESG